MICLCNNWYVFRLGSRTELGAKLIKICISIVLFVLFFVTFWFKNIKIAKKYTNGFK